MVVDDDVVELVVVARVVVVVVARVVIVVVVSSATGIELFSSLKETTKEINKIKIITKIFDFVDRSKNLFQRDENNILYNLNIGIKKLFKNNGKNILKNLLIALKKIFIVLKRVFIFPGY